MARKRDRVSATDRRELEALLRGELVFSPGFLKLMGMKSDAQLAAELYEEVHGACAPLWRN